MTLPPPLRLVSTHLLKELGVLSRQRRKPTRRALQDLTSDIDRVDSDLAVNLADGDEAEGVESEVFGVKVGAAAEVDTLPLDLILVVTCLGDRKLECLRPRTGFVVVDLLMVLASQPLCIDRHLRR
jgi:hypothetical protein